MGDTEKAHTYDVTTSWTGEKRGALEAEAFPLLDVATPPEFGGHPGTWTPEHLFVAAANACVMTTFLAIAGNSDLLFSTYRSAARGTLEEVAPLELAFTRILIEPQIVVPDKRNAKRAERILKRASKLCLISNSVKTEITVEPRITIEEPAKP